MHSTRATFRSWATSRSFTGISLLCLLLLMACSDGDKAPPWSPDRSEPDLAHDMALDQPLPDRKRPDTLAPDVRPWSCGNGLAEGIEKCDGKDLNNQTCITLGYFKGTLGCQSTCIWDLTKCTNCGNGTLEPTENCDGTNMGQYTCQKVGFLGGSLVCEECVIKTQNCHNCGDGKIDPLREECDGQNLNNKTCASIGYKGGTLKCTGTCVFDKSGCN